MKINRVHLENYRVHENLDIEFTTGINLLLGKNGKGKSSILEAIGIALFDSKPRTTLDDAVSFGKKSGKIEISFTGIDGEEYTVTKRIPSGGAKLCRVSDNTTIDGKGEKIKELCGIKGDIKDIYDNVIVAKQNEFISAFKEKPANREKIFNKVFNTDIYTNIYNNNSLQALRRYENELNIENAKISSKKDSLEDSEKIKEELENSRKDLALYKAQYEQLDKARKEISKTKELINSLNIKLEQTNHRKNIAQNSIEGFISDGEKLKKSIIETENAEKIVEENRENFEKYRVLHGEIQKIKGEKQRIETLKNEYLYKDREEVENSKTISVKKGNLDVLNNKIENLNKIINERNETIQSLTEEIKEKKVLEDRYKNELLSIRPLIQTSDRFENDIANLDYDIEGLKKQLKDKQIEEENLKLQLENLKNENLDEKLDKIKEYEKEIETLSERNTILDTKNHENKEAYEILKSSECPYLREKCENLKGKNIEEFFAKKFHAIQEEKIANIEKINQAEECIKDKDEIQRKLLKITILIDDINRKTHEIETTNLKVENATAQSETIKTKYENFKLTNSFSSIKELSEKEISIKVQLDNLNLETSISNWRKLTKEIANLNMDLKGFLKSAEDNRRIIENLNIKNQELKRYLDENRDILSKFEKIKNHLEEQENILETLEHSKNIYLENYQKSLGKDSLLKELEHTKRCLDIEKENFGIIEKEVLKLKEEISKYDIEKISRDEREIADKITINRENFGKTSSLIETYEEKIKEIKKEEENLKLLKKAVKKLEAKIELTKKFRDNIKNMGREVSKNMLKEIEILATDNFRKITGRGEKIVWSNDDSDKYLVYLVSNTEKLKFEQLSGGEQVAVAISIRSAMSNLFTDSKFSIFDEPTNNLDSERRQSLADSIGEILKDLEQSIIVTHDDTFREMAEKVIIL